MDNLLNCWIAELGHRIQTLQVCTPETVALFTQTFSKVTDEFCPFQPLPPKKRSVNTSFLLIISKICVSCVQQVCESVSGLIYHQLAPVLPQLPWPSHNPPATAAVTAECHHSVMAVLQAKSDKMPQFGGTRKKETNESQKLDTVTEQIWHFLSKKRWPFSFRCHAGRVWKAVLF